MIFCNVHVVVKIRQQKLDIKKETVSDDDADRQQELDDANEDEDEDIYNDQNDDDYVPDGWYINI